jgi:hypothetical protein
VLFLLLNFLCFAISPKMLIHFFHTYLEYSFSLVFPFLRSSVTKAFCIFYLEFFFICSVQRCFAFITYDTQSFGHFLDSLFGYQSGWNITEKEFLL